jgi:hypothetical protein
MTTFPDSSCARPSDQSPLFDEATPDERWGAGAAHRALDDLLTQAGRYSSTSEYRDLLTFVTRFRMYSPYNAMLVHTQLPGARYVATPRTWRREYGRNIRPDARPLVILQPMGPVMFVFDVADTEAGPHALPLPRAVDQPFEVRGGQVGKKLPRTIGNAVRDGIRVSDQSTGSQRAGSIQPALPGRFLYPDCQSGTKPLSRIPLRYEMLLSDGLSAEAKYACLVHELAHLYCGHLGTPEPRWWPDRRGGSRVFNELEAESVSFLVCKRLGIETASDEYLAGYFGATPKMHPVSLDCVMKAAGLIEQMGSRKLPPRKERTP